MNNYSSIIRFLIGFISIVILIGTISPIVDSQRKGGRRGSCGMNAFWNECATACPENCYNYGRPRPCTLNCLQRCSCRSGFVFESSSSSSRCIPIGHCRGRGQSGRRWNRNFQRNWRYNNNNYYYG
ncbi:chymotrypsin-elastase inhibitor ixodidin-like protein [Dermatophagoides farinae]|uniref:Chymotrypsin-elastase inhibitor ixodidin-like protein n=1 Tax=Dermatophagoides farinae TaxID=6954 RepID=A0A9D4P1U0_DERFA|nr:chymotrypsin-elastase inhibitor ixodidin-like protein [Dermatophagoides farinae]